MSGEAQLILAIVGMFVGGGFATLLGVLTNSLLKAQRQQGEQQVRWEKIVDQKDKQITKLEEISEKQVKKIEVLEKRLDEVESRAKEAEAKVVQLEWEVRRHG